MDKNIEEIEERVKNKNGHWQQRLDIEYLLSRIKELFVCEEDMDKLIGIANEKELEILKLESHIRELENGINEVLDGTLPYLAEKRLREFVK